MFLDIILIAIGVIFIFAGIIGCIVPIIPGPPVGYVGLIMLQFIRDAETGERTFSLELMIIAAVIVIGVTILDYIVPVWGTKKFGGTKWGKWGSTIGLLVAFFVLPFLGIVIGPFGLIGIIMGPFFGALVGEKLGNQDNKIAFKSAIGSFIGFLTGVFMKLCVCIWMAVIFFRETFHTIVDYF